MSVHPEAQQWTESAERDRQTVQILVKATPTPYEIVGYHCQQCAEKYLKALYVQKSMRPS
jgi:HEPN domain-containing protein